MKKVRICAVCQKPYRQNRMYKVRLEKQAKEIAPGFYQDIPARVVFICPECNRISGYKSHKKEK